MAKTVRRTKGKVGEVKGRKENRDLANRFYELPNLHKGTTLVPETLEALKARLKEFPGDVSFQEGSNETHLISWVNGHCFMWSRKTEKDTWECEEL